MENLKDFYQSLKERFANPLVFSFIWAWAIFNWEIVICLIFYKQEEVKSEGYQSIFQFIKAHQNIKENLYYPLGVAVLYVFLMPLFRNLIKAFYAWVSTWGENWNLKISKDAKIPISKYISMRNEYDKRSKILEETISKDNRISEEYENLKTELFDYRNKLDEEKQNVASMDSKFRQITDMSVLDGYWNVKYEDRSTGIFGEENVQISEGKYLVIDKGGIKTQEFTIINFQFQSNTKSLSFIKDRYAQKNYIEERKINIKNSTTKLTLYNLKFNLNILSISAQGLLNGFENNVVRITYEKKNELEFLLPNTN